MNSIIFDIDGTLIDSVDLHAKAWQDAFEHFGVKLGFAEIRSQIGKGGDELVPTFLSKKDERAFGEELQEWRSQHFKSTYRDSVKPFHKSHELLQRIKQKGKLLAAGSSAKKDELDYYLELLNAKDLFDVTTSADDVNKSKPNPDIFEAALSKLQNSASETVVVGDSPYDAQAATRIGIPCVGVLCGGFAKQSLVDAGATAIYKGPEDLLDKLESSPLFK